MTGHFEASMLKKVRPSADTVASVVAAFEGLAGTKATPIRKGWKGYLGCETDGHLFLGVQTQSKPPKQVLALVIRNGNSIVFPTESEDEFRAGSQALGLTSDEQLVRLFEFCNLEYGLIEKSEPAALLNDGSAFEKVGLSAAEFQEADGDWKSIWWQCWGGKLYGTGSSGQGVKVLKTRCGKFKRLPYWLVR